MIAGLPPGTRGPSAGAPDLDGHAVVITGAGQGLGAAYARAAAALGARIVVNDIHAASAHQVASDIKASGGIALAQPGDVRDPAHAHDLVAACMRTFGSITGLVNNAAIFIPEPFEDATLEHLRLQLEVNVVGVFNCTKAAWGPLVRQGHGSIVNVTSGAQTGQAGRSCYGATKGAVATLTYAWAAELKARGVRVNAVSPIANTAMAASIARPLPEAAVNAPVVMFLLSDLACEVSGQVIRIDGRRLSLMCHPANRAPVLEQDAWSLASIAEAFRSTLHARQLPVDLATYDIAGVSV